jgi:hypothetical protein
VVQVLTYQVPAGPPPGRGAKSGQGAGTTCTQRDISGLGKRNMGASRGAEPRTAYWRPPGAKGHSSGDITFYGRVFI